MNKILRFLMGIAGLLIAMAAPVNSLQEATGRLQLAVIVLCTALVIAMIRTPKRWRSASGREVVRCGGVNINLADGQLGGTIQTNDGIGGFVMTGVSEPAGYTLATPLLVTSMADVATAGITQTNNPFAFKNLTEFYNQAGSGASLYLMLVSNTQTPANICDNTNANGAKKLLDFAAGAIKFIGVLTDDAAIGSGVQTVIIHSGSAGTGYATNDTSTIVGGNGDALALITISAQTAGVPTAITVTVTGEGYALGTNIATTNVVGTGTGLKVDITALDGITVTNGLNASVYTAAANMKVMAAAYFAAEKPFRAIIGGTSYAGTASALTTENSGTSNSRVAILVGDTVSGAGACMGLLLGVIASIPVQRKISRVRNGALTNTAAYLGSTALGSTGGDAFTIASKGYITWTTYPNVSGFYFSGDPMLTATTDDYCMLARGRVIDKAHILAYTTFVQEVDDEVPVNTDGTLDAGFCKWLSQQIVNQINNTMTANQEISAVSCYINPAQNILSTNILAVTLSITPVGYATTIDITLGFNNPSA